MTAALAALALGFFGSLHCLAMCGGIAGALCATRSGSAPAGRATRAVAYNLGRVASYAVAGAAAGAFGAVLAGAGGAYGAALLRGVAALLIVGAGLYVAGWSLAIARIEAVGARLWRKVAPIARRLAPASSAASAFGLGLAWGWLPCGLVYSALVVAAASGSTLAGVATMVCFGLGTLPAMVSVAWAAEGGMSVFRSLSARRLAGATVVAFGVWTLAGAAELGLAAHRAPSPAAGAEQGCHHEAPR